MHFNFEGSEINEEPLVGQQTLADTLDPDLVHSNPVGQATVAEQTLSTKGLVGSLRATPHSHWTKADNNHQYNEIIKTRELNSLDSTVGHNMKITQRTKENDKAIMIGELYCLDSPVDHKVSE